MLFFRFFLVMATCAHFSSAWADEIKTSLVPKGLIRLGQGKFFSTFALVVDKKARLLTVWKEDDRKLAKVAEYPSDMGKNEGDKGAEGDHKTPEGIYFFQKLLEGPGLPFELYGSRAFTMDYPNLFDRRLGRKGSGIWLHAVPDKVGLERGSRGCVVVRDDAIKEIGKYITLEKTPIVVYDAVAYVEEPERQKGAKEVEDWLKTWITAWKSKDLEKYMSFYSPTFNGNGMNKDQWKVYKKNLNFAYENINVQLYAPVVFEHNKGWVIRSLQEYKSEKHEDFGEKTLHLQKEDGELKIIEESWVAVKRNEEIQNLAKCCESETPAASN
jgi:murein L,D-transpeptidase YafK